MPRTEPMRRMDLVGVGLAAAFASWTVVSAAVNEGSRPWPLLGATAGAVAVVGVGRAVRAAMARTDRVAGDSLVVLAAVLFGTLTAFDVGDAGGGPLGYENANGALFAALVFAPCVVGVSAPAARRTVRAGAAVLAAVAAGACVLTGSVGAILAMAAGGAIAAAAILVRRPAAAGPLAAAAVALGTAVVIAIALGAGPDDPGTGDLDTRVLLWREAADLAGDHPIAGVGPGRFQDENTVSTDPDLRRAHSAPLQAAAELGLPGLVLFLALEGWAFAALWVGAQDAAVAVGAAAITAAALQGSIDWVLAEPAVLLIVAGVVGATTVPAGPAPVSPASPPGQESLGSPRPLP